MIPFIPAMFAAFVWFLSTADSPRPGATYKKTK